VLERDARVLDSEPVITLYSVLLFLHILGAAIWLGGEAVMLGLRALALRSGDRERTVALVRDTDRINILVISPAVAVLLGAGLWLVLEGQWGFDQFFVIFGLAGFATSSLFGGVFTFPTGKKLQTAVERNGADSAQVGLLLRRIQLGLLVDVIILTAIVFVMATKPSL
jgi:uncharacterized membrane protein